MPVVAKRNPRVQLPDHFHVRLRLCSLGLGRPATVLAREAIERWLDEYERSQLDKSISRYARQAAATADDLDDELQSASLESWAEPEARD